MDGRVFRLTCPIDAEVKTMVSPQLSEQKVQWCSIPLDRTQERIAMPQPESDTWVQLLDPESFSTFCGDEALLLCSLSNWEWVAWIPAHGEATVNINQFCMTRSAD